MMTSECTGVPTSCLYRACKRVKISVNDKKIGWNGWREERERGKEKREDKWILSDVFSLSLLISLTDTIYFLSSGT